MKRIWVLIIFWAAFGATIASGDELSGNGSGKPLNIVCNDNGEPLTLRTAAGRPNGFLINLWRLWSEKTGRQVTFSFNSPEGALNDLKSRRADIHVGLIPDSAQSEWIELSRPIYSSVTTLFYPVDSKNKNLGKLSKKKVGVVAGTPLDKFLRENYPHFEILPFKSIKSILYSAERDHLDAFAVDDIKGHFAIKQLGIHGDFESKKEVLTVDDLSAGVLKGREDLLQLIDEGFRAITDQEIMELERRWIDDPDLRHFTRLHKKIQMTEGEKKWLENHRSIRIGMDEAFPPFSFSKEDGSRGGLVSDYVRLMEKMFHVETEMVPTKNWADVMEKVESGIIDVLPAASKTPQRLKYLNFTRPYISLPLVIITRNEAPYVGNINELKGERLAVTDHYQIHEMIERDFPDQSLLLVKNNRLALRAVSSGRAYAVIMNLPSFSYLTREMGLTHLKVSAITPYKSTLSFAVRKDWPELVNILDKGIAQLSEEDKNRIYNRWFNSQFTHVMDFTHIRRIVIIVSIGVGLFMLVSFLRWKYRLHREKVEHKRTGSALEKSEQLFRSFVSNVPGIVYRYPVDSFDSLFFVSDEVEKICGYPKSNFLKNRHLYPDIIHPEDKQRYIDAVVLATRDKITFNCEYRIIHASGDIRWVHEKGTPTLNEEGKIAFIDGIVLDITNRKQTEAALSKSEIYLQTILETATWGFVFINNDGVIEDLNPALAKMISLPEEKIVGQRIIDFFGGDENVLVTDELSKRNQGVESSYQTSLVRPDGTGLPVLVSGTPYYDESGKITGSFGIVTDVTKFKQIEKELRHARLKAEEANYAKGNFLAMISHEIRTPMNGIIGLSNLLQRTDLTPKQQDYLAKVQSSADSLLKIINSILDFSKIERGKMEVESLEFNLYVLLDQLANTFGLAAGKKGLEILFMTGRNVPCDLTGDPLRLGQVLNNLISNAIKFTESGDITVFIDTEKEEKGEIILKFSIRDTGIGFTDAQAEKIFQPFIQADVSTTRRYGGTGLGLPICKRLVELMGGEISVSSIPGKGSNFTFTARLRSKSRECNDFLQIPESRIRIMIVDDNETSLRMITETLNPLHCEVITASSGTEALARLHQLPKDGPCNLVLLDWDMPGMNGIETAAKINQFDGWADVPKILMVSTYDREKAGDAVNRAGILQILTKPLNRSSLFDCVIDSLGYEIVKKAGPAESSLWTHEAFQKIRGARVLVAEDNGINRQVVTELLEGAGMEVIAVNDGRACVRAVSEADYDLVFMDIQMPEMDGLEACKRIRDMGGDKSRNLPIIAMTAHAMVGDREKSLQAGMNGHVTKPIDPDELYATLVEWIKPGGRPGSKELPFQEKCCEDNLVFPEIPGVATREGLLRVLGNKQLYRKLLKGFYVDFAGFGKQLKTALRAQDKMLAAHLTHTIQGVAGNIGALGVQDAAKKLEAEINRGEKNQLDFLMNLFLNELDPVLESLERFSNDHGDGLSEKNKTSMPEPEDLIRKMKALEVDLGKRRPIPCKKAFQALACLPWTGKNSEEMKRLGSFINKYKFKDAEIILDSMIRRMENRGNKNG